MRLFGEFLLAKGLGDFLIGGLFLQLLVCVHRQFSPVVEQQFELHLGGVELDGGFVGFGLLPFFGFGLEFTYHGFALFQPCHLVGGKGMPVLLRRDAHLVSREGCEFVRFLVTADEGRDFLARPVGEFDNAPHVPGGLDSVAIFLREGMPEELLLQLLGIENTVAANDYPAVGSFTQGKLAVVGMGDRIEIEIYPDGLVGLEAP